MVPLFFYLLTFYQVSDSIYHTPDLRRIVMKNGAVQLPQSQSDNRFLLPFVAIDGASHLGNFQLGHI